MNNFVDLLKRAFALWWRVKILWPLGVLAALVGYGDAAVSGNFNVSQPIGDDPEAAIPPWLLDLAESQLVRDVIANPWPYVAALIVGSIGLAIVFGLVGALAHGALIRVADVADQGYTASLSDGLRVGAARLGPIFLLNLILALPVILVVAALGAVVAVSIAGAISSAGPGFDAEPGPIIASVLGLIFCVLAVVLLLWVAGVLLGIWSRVAQRVCVIEGLGPLASLGRAWRLIIRNLGLTLLTWLLQGVLGGVVGFILAIPAAALAFPAIISAAQGGNLSAPLLVAIFVYAVAASVLVGGVLTAFNSAMWTVIYRAFAAGDRPYESYGAA